MVQEDPQTYRNAMESLVEEELERQLRLVPNKLLDYIRQAEVIAYALNRLPPLYATCEKGWKQQRIRGRQELGTQIAAAVRHGLAAVQQDPLRVSVPLQVKQKPEEKPASEQAEAALEALKRLLRARDLTWLNLATVVREALIDTARGKAQWQHLVPLTDGSGDWEEENFDY